ncbi:cystatin-like protein [Labeo rohita]|uniref:cystatin-like protein n=1 Tax=Labeo rohita TaxID=84645 RepID=UPI0021E24F84|nr:cystatin-like protein [Labeo rohita]
MGKTADMAMVQKTIIDTLHIEREDLSFQSRPITAVVICVDVTAVTDSEKHQTDSSALQLLVKMRGLLFLLSALFLLDSTKGTEYEKLNEHDREIVDKAIEQGNKDHGNGKHLDFFIIANRDTNLLNVILRPTSCASTTPSVHRKDCKTEDKRPYVSCIDCNGRMEPCLRLGQIAEINKRIDECPKSHHTGRSHLLFQKGGNEQQQTGCLGCI